MVFSSPNAIFVPRTNVKGPGRFVKNTPESSTKRTSEEQQTKGTEKYNSNTTVGKLNASPRSKRPKTLIPRSFQLRPETYFCGILMLVFSCILPSPLLSSMRAQFIIFGSSLLSFWHYIVYSCSRFIDWLELGRLRFPELSSSKILEDSWRFYEY